MALKNEGRLMHPSPDHHSFLYPPSQARADNGVILNLQISELQNSKGISVMKTMKKSDFEKCFFFFSSDLTAYRKRNQGRNLRQELQQRLWRNAAYWPAPWLSQSAF